METPNIIVGIIGLLLSSGAICFAVWRKAEEVNEQAKKAEHQQASGPHSG